MDDLVRRMRDAGYLNSFERADRAFRVWWLWALLVGTGVYRIVTGMIHEQPVGYLVATAIAAGVTGLVLVLVVYSRRAPDPTRRGRDALANAAVMVGGTLLLPVALAGLTAHPDPDMGDALATATDSHPHVPTSSSSDGGGSGDSGSSCGGGGCGGCGGCS
ncbi:hypothetical protein ACFQV2_08650 [Actinokineospora soli]|uniref:DUF202 domain-containing protein n=1 Tax=Actinokineospora soli TaxID=1048753 RepID=A0ABW2TJT0_9PSEU